MSRSSYTLSQPKFMSSTVNAGTQWKTVTFMLQEILEKLCTQLQSLLPWSGSSPALPDIWQETGPSTPPETGLYYSLLAMEAEIALEAWFQALSSKGQG